MLIDITQMKIKVYIVNGINPCFNQNQLSFIHLHKDIKVRIRLNVGAFFSSQQFSQHFCQLPKFVINHTYIRHSFLKNSSKFIWNEKWEIKLTISMSDSLASCRKGQCFPYSHFTYMNIILTDVSSRSLGYKFIHRMTIVSHLSRKLHQKLNF